jgi:hypothetical protein
MKGNTINLLKIFFLSKLLMDIFSATEMPYNLKKFHPSSLIFHGKIRGYDLHT